MKNDQATTMSISLPKDLKEHVKRRTKQEHYGTPSDYIRSLIRGDLKKNEQEYLEKILLEGLASGPGAPMTTSRWKKIHTELRTRLKERA